MDPARQNTVSPDEAALTLPALNRTTSAEYCRAVLRARHNEFWWYFNGLAPFRGYSKPFSDSSGRWWYRVKPAFAWPVDFFHPLPEAPKNRSFRRLLGWQYPVEEAHADSLVRLNVIEDVSGYSLEGISGKKRRWTIRKALRELAYTAADPADAAVANDACEVWNSHVERTGWNKRMSPEEFRASWSELATCPGTTLITAREREEPHSMCAWLIGRVIDDIAFIDTLASHTDRVAGGPNDGLVFLYVKSAAAMGVRHAHYGLHSKIESLESFKQSLGFEAKAFPARLRLRFPVRIGLQLFRPRLYARLQGKNAEVILDHAPITSSETGDRQ